VSKKTEKQQKERAKRREAKRKAMERPGATRKKAYLTSNPWNPETDDCPVGRKSRRLFGFEVSDPKPWGA
jgi:hypothetical protein